MSAVISMCGQYRYHLRRSGLQGALDGKGTVCFVMLNPSTADANLDDPTIRRCMGFARQWGYGTLSVVNLFAFRTPSPPALLEAQEAGVDIVGPENIQYVHDAVRSSQLLVAAWGAMSPKLRPWIARTSYPRLDRRGTEVFFAQPVHVLGLTKDGYPRHPLYLRRDVEAVRP